MTQSPGDSATELQQLREGLHSGRVLPAVAVAKALAQANTNSGKNVYISAEGPKALREAENLPSRFPADPAAKPRLYGLPVSLKDCFDLAGFRTSCGTDFYAGRNGFSNIDSAVAARLRAQGAIIVGKTHLHPLAYGITGENPDYGDCAQPRDAQRLTGGSSSGAAASVQEGSAIAAIGTDTGGSIRVPAALCGLAGYRATIDAAHERGLWRGSMHLAPSFDTLGWLFRDLRDAPLLAEALFGFLVPEWLLPPAPVPSGATQPPQSSQPSNGHHLRVACVNAAFTHDCDSAVLVALTFWQQKLTAAGAEIFSFDSSFWEGAVDIFAPIQASEAAAIHTPATSGDFSHFERSIAQRLSWGASIDAAEIKRLRRRHAGFRDRMDVLLREYDFVIAPCAPASRLLVGADHSGARNKILRYTAPFSLAGAPVVTLPGPWGTGVQLGAARGLDARLLSFAAYLGSL
jgi:Asp-tRNA(Asn)/Glu-tRNA(Gln) amidotransferase A subunit family amidase